MERFTKISAIAMPFLQSNIDTDTIIPGDQLMQTETSGYKNSLFSNWRYQRNIHGDRVERPDFILNQAPYKQAEILLAGPNFACGSSREHAAWALRDWGFRCIIAPSFGEIFYVNCFKNQILPVVLDFATVKTIAEQVTACGGNAKVTVDLDKGLIIVPDGQQFTFSISDYFRNVLLQGIDPVQAVLYYDAAITSFQESDRKHRPWIYADTITVKQQGSI